jgi:hypothetical protein
MKLYNQPIEGVEIYPSDIPPIPGDVLLGYKLVIPDKKIFSRPRPARMNVRGWLGFLFGSLFCFPLMCMPCCMSCSYDEYQVPVYGPPKKSY